MSAVQPWIFANLRVALSNPGGSAPTAFTGEDIPVHIREPRTAALLEFYRWLPAGAGPPQRSLADAVSLKPWLGNLMILEPIDGGEDFRYRLYGTAIAEVAGFDMTGRRVSDFASRTGAFFMGIYQRAMADDSVWLTHNLGEHARRFVVWERLVLPFATAPGDRHIVVSNIPISVALPTPPA